MLRPQSRLSLSTDTSVFTQSPLNKLSPTNDFRRSSLPSPTSEKGAPGPAASSAAIAAAIATADLSGLSKMSQPPSGPYSSYQSSSYDSQSRANSHSDRSTLTPSTLPIQSLDLDRTRPPPSEHLLQSFPGNKSIADPASTPSSSDSSSSQSQQRSSTSSNASIGSSSRGYGASGFTPLMQDVQLPSDLRLSAGSPNSTLSSSRPVASSKRSNEFDDGALGQSNLRRLASQPVLSGQPSGTGQPQQQHLLQQDHLQQQQQQHFRSPFQRRSGHDGASVAGQAGSPPTHTQILGGGERTFSMQQLGEGPAGGVSASGGMSTPLRHVRSHASVLSPTASYPASQLHSGMSALHTEQVPTSTTSSSSVGPHALGSHFSTDGVSQLNVGSNAVPNFASASGPNHRSGELVSGSDPFGNARRHSTSPVGLGYGPVDSGRHRHATQPGHPLSRSHIWNADHSQSYPSSYSSSNSGVVGSSSTSSPGSSFQHHQASGAHGNVHSPTPQLIRSSQLSSMSSNSSLASHATITPSMPSSSSSHSLHSRQHSNVMDSPPPAMRAKLQIHGNLNEVAVGWSHDEWRRGRRLVQFWRRQEGTTIHAMCKPINPQEYVPNSVVVSCIFREDKNECYVTSVDTIYLLEALVGSRFTIEEKNRIRRNLEGFRPITVSKSKRESEPFFKLIMGFPNPKPRNIEKDVKVFPWKVLSEALRKIISKYSAATEPTLAAPNPAFVDDIGAASLYNQQMGRQSPQQRHPHYHPYNQGHARTSSNSSSGVYYGHRSGEQHSSFDGGNASGLYMKDENDNNLPLPQFGSSQAQILSVGNRSADFNIANSSGSSNFEAAPTFDPNSASGGSELSLYPASHHHSQSFPPPGVSTSQYPSASGQTGVLTGAAPFAASPVSFGQGRSDASQQGAGVATGANAGSGMSGGGASNFAHYGQQQSYQHHSDPPAALYQQPQSSNVGIAGPGAQAGNVYPFPSQGHMQQTAAGYQQAFPR